MRIVICDDDKETVERIKEIVLGFFAEKKYNKPQIDVYYSGDSLLEDKQKKDIVFLDVEMPGRDGIYVGRKLLEYNKNTILIIITSFPEYIDDAMRINVFRYISKPIDSKRLKRNISDALSAYSIRKDKYILIDSSKGLARYSCSEVIMFEMVGRKVMVHTSKETVESDKTLKEWMNKLPDNLFYQCHRSYIVNISRIKKILPDMIIMDMGEKEAYLTKRKHSELKKKWMLYIESSH